MERFKHRVGDLVVKDSGDYVYRGWIVGRYHKRSGKARYVVENVDGLNYIMTVAQLRPMTNLEATAHLMLSAMMRKEPASGTALQDTIKRMTAEGKRKAKKGKRR